MKTYKRIFHPDVPISDLAVFDAIEIENMYIMRINIVVSRRNDNLTDYVIYNDDSEWEYIQYTLMILDLDI